MLTVSQIQDILREFQYKPGWTFELIRLRDLWGDDAMLSINFPADDSREGTPEPLQEAWGPDGKIQWRPYFPIIPIGVRHVLYLEQFPDEQTFLRWLHHTIKVCEIHEVDEHFRYRGELLFDPHKGDRNGQ